MIDANLLRSITSEKIASALGGGVSAALVDTLVRSPRFGARLAGLVLSRLGDLGSPTHQQAAVLAMQSGELSALACRAGCVWHAGAIARIIDGAARRALVDSIGDENYALAFAYRELQPPGVAHERSPDDLVRAIAADGAACLAAWSEAQPAPMAMLLRLMRPDASPGSLHETWGVAIVARLLADRL